MEPDPVKQFILQPQGLKAIKNNYLKFGLWVSFLVFAISLYKDGFSKSNLIGDAFGVVLFTFVIWMMLKRVGHLYDQLTVRLNSELLEKKVHHNMYPVLIKAADIKMIRRTFNGGFQIEYKSSILFIPSQIDNRTELEEALKSLGVPFIAGPYSFVSKHLPQIFYLIVGLYLLDLTIDNKIFIISDSLMLICFVLIAAIRSFKINKTIRQRVVVFYLVLLSIMVYTLITRLDPNIFPPK